MRRDGLDACLLDLCEKRFKHFLREPQAIECKSQLYSVTTIWGLGRDLFKSVYNPLLEYILSESKRLP
jgi:hypothetical protein